LDAGNSCDVEVWLRNVGTGIALISAESCIIKGRAKSEGIFFERTGAVDAPALPPGETAQIRFRVEGSEVSMRDFLNRHKTLGDFFISITYSDVNGEQEVRADAHIAAIDSDGYRWRFHRIAYTRATEGESFAAVEFDARFDSSTS